MITTITDTETRLTNTLRMTTEALTLVTAERDALQEALQATARAEDELKVEIEHLHTVMMAAAVEISEHWDAHCDDEGYGPCNLVRRLENGFPAQYGYDAMTLVNLEKQRDEYQRAADSMAAAHKVERDALRADAERWRKYKARKAAVLSAGMARNPLRQKPPCGECHLSPGEICDICGASTEGTP